MNEKDASTVLGASPVVEQLHRVSMYFGRVVNGRHHVSEESFMDFISRQVASKLSAFSLQDTLHVFNGVAEPTTVLEFFSTMGDEVKKLLVTIAQEYQKRFEQDTVLMVLTPAAGFEFVKERTDVEEKSLLVLP